MLAYYLIAGVALYTFGTAVPACDATLHGCGLTLHRLTYGRRRGAPRRASGGLTVSSERRSALCAAVGRDADADLC